MLVPPTDTSSAHSKRVRDRPKQRIELTLACYGTSKEREVCLDGVVACIEATESILTGFTVYVGKAASLSFLQLLRETVTQHIGPSQFSHNYKSEDMLETEAHHDPLNFSEEDCSIEAKRRFIQTFSIAVRP